ncbi:MAG TPA: AAA family ATPase [Gaiellaceae bacterium]|nr:AAA family ATPase [Gaiellaceae bacterium]
MAVTAAPEQLGLLERDEVLEELRGALAEAGDGRGRMVLVAGEAGVGKTAVVQAFCDEQGRNVRILQGACDPLFTPRPLGPFMDIADDAGGELGAVLEAGGSAHELVSALLAETSRRRPAIVVLEDVHWADEATLDALRLLARKVDRAAVLVLVTYRDDELERMHPLRAVVGELATGDIVARMRLAPLSRDAVAELAEPHGVDANELYDKTGGNPFFVVEALATGVDGIPETVRDAVLARATRLSPAGRSLLEAIAVVPQQVELWLLDALASDVADRLDECVASGMLTFESTGVAFRHELARLAVEDSVAPQRRLELHRRAVAALVGAPGGDVPDLARLAHHAEAAGDIDGVLRFAPAAADRAASLGAYREAAAQYARALRFGARLPAAERAELLERRSHACYLTDQNDAAVEAIEGALECRRLLGQRLEEGDSLRWLSQILWCPGRTVESAQAAREAVTLLEALPPGRELAMAYANLADSYANAGRRDEAVTWSERALVLAERLDEKAIAAFALTTIGGCEWNWEKLEQSLELEDRAGLAEQVGRTYIWLVGAALSARLYSLANRHLDAGIDYCSDRGLERDRLYLLAFRARMALDQGRWEQAADNAAAVIRVPRTSITPRIVALSVLGLLRARRGDPGQWQALDEAWALAEPTGELPRLAPVVTARAEAAWLEGDRDGVAEATDAVLPLALERDWRLLVSDLLLWRRRAGVEQTEPPDATDPGDWALAAERWRELGCPYEAALALADADEEEPLRQALEELQRLEARPAAAIVSRRLRELGVRGVARGPRPSTRRNEAQLTNRELDVVRLLADGLRNAAIAERLFVSPRTVDHHVSSILRKLDVQSRGEAVAEARRLALLQDPKSALPSGRESTTI